MRNRTDTSYEEVHGKALRIFEFLADGTKDSSTICSALETALGLRLQGDPAGQHGYVNTARLADGSRFVAVVLYEACAGCAAHAIPLLRAATPNATKLAAAKVAVGEHLTKKLTGAAADVALLRSLGFTDDDPPLRTTK